jgi:hypothetical protein
MRYVTLVAAIAVAATFSMAPAKAELSGVQAQNGQCRILNGESTTLGYYYWGACPKAAAAAVVHHHVRHHKG